VVAVDRLPPQPAVEPDMSRRPRSRRDAPAHAGHPPPAAAGTTADAEPRGLTSAEAAARLAKYGPNVAGRRSQTDALTLLLRQFASPIILILTIATVLSGVLGDLTDMAIILAILALSGLLGFWQERGATRAVEDLLAAVRVTAEVRRDGRSVDVPMEAVVPGDVVILNAGDLVPADCTVLESRTLLVDESALTGESVPVEKGGEVPGGTSLFLGTHVVSGSATAVIVATGASTRFAGISARLAVHPSPTGFERGLTAFGYLLVRAMTVLVVAIFIVNLILARPLIDSALFSLALAVGLTPQLLPAIVTISLSEGARRMARRRVIVKRLDAIEDFGSMTVLCTDKTGTMTQGTVVLDGAVGVDGQPSDEVRRLALLNATLQTGFANPIDAAIQAAGGPAIAGTSRVDELPYDFTRRRLTVLIRDGDRQRLITKGAFDAVLAVCSQAEAAPDRIVDLTDVADRLRAAYAERCNAGARILAVASRDVPAGTRLDARSERDLVFRGLLVFSDPPKPGARDTVADLARAGVSVRMITGDNPLTAAHVGAAVGLDPSAVLTGDAIAALDDRALAERAGRTAIFAAIEPVAKERIIRALRASGQVVGYLGDGINDAPALHAADVGISVDTAVDVARDAAAIVLLDKDLEVLLDGIRQGRRTFANTMKYVFTTTSANFGNMLSMAVAAAVLPFLPLLAGQILLINFLSDIPSTTIATDEVDPELLERPRGWDIGFVRAFMVVFGGISSAFDLATFAILGIGFAAVATLFRSGWFIESVSTELAVLFVLRTRRAFFLSSPSRILVVSSVAVAVLTVAIPYSPFAGMLGLAGLDVRILVALAAVTASYVATTELAKRFFFARYSS
jgi:Mg2+-importing ATPase